MTYDPNDTPAAQFERYIAAVEERPCRQVKPARWWHFPLLAPLGTAVRAAWIWNFDGTQGGQTLPPVLEAN